MRSTLVFDRRSIQEVDRRAIEEYGVPGIVLMENAALGLAHHAGRMVASGGTVLICCGSGNNGGDGYALARHLHNRGVRAVLAPLKPPRPDGDAAVNERICADIGLERVAREQLDELDDVRLIVDGLFGTGLDREIRGDAADWVRWMNAHPARLLAIDVPSGLDCDTGRPLGDAAVRADVTVTFVGLKQGFLEPGARDYTGEVEIVDIGAPVELYQRHGRLLETDSSSRAGRQAADSQ